MKKKLILPLLLFLTYNMFGIACYVCTTTGSDTYCASSCSNSTKLIFTPAYRACDATQQTSSFECLTAFYPTTISVQYQVGIGVGPCPHGCAFVPDNTITPNPQPITWYQCYNDDTMCGGNS